MKISQYTVVARFDLGQTRVSNYLAYNHLSSDNSFDDITPREMTRLVKDGKVNGLKLDSNGEIALDEAFEQKNLVVKSASRFKNMIETGKSSTGYSVICKYLNDLGDSYELVSSRCGRFSCSAEKLLMLVNFAHVACVRVNGSDIEVCEGVQIIDDRTHADPKSYNPSAVLDVGGVLMPASDLTMAELFGTGGIEEKTEGLQADTDSTEPENAEPVSTEVVEPEKTEPVGTEGVEQPVKENEGSEPVKTDEPAPTPKKPASKGAAAKKKS